jgi:hypothetical protein
MNSKERVRAAIAGEPVDRIPLGFYVVDCDTIERVIGRKTYVRNKVGSQVAFWEGRRDEVVESYKHDTVEFYERIDCADLICFKEAPIVPPRDYEPRPPRRIDDDTWRDDEGRVFRVSHVSNELVCVDDPTVSDVEAYTTDMFPEFDESEYRPPDPSIFEACDYIIEKLGGWRYIAGSSGGIVAYTLLGGDVTGMMLYALKPDVIRAANRQRTGRANLDDGYYIRPGQDGVLLEQDSAGTNGPLISPRQYRENCLPFLGERVANIKRFDRQVLMHNCGDNRPLMDMFVEAGVECYQSLQTNAGMGLDELTARWGRDMTFWGGVPVELLVDGTAEEVRASVRSAMEKGRRGRGFILGPSHSIAYGTKYDNFMAMLDEHHKLAHIG